MLKNDGTLWGCGYNGKSQLGLGDTDYRYTFTQIITNIDNIKLVYCGESYTLILKNDDTLWGCGANDYGQLGLGDKTDRTIFTKIANDVKSVNCGLYHILILKNDGTLWGCGKNNNGELGLGDTTDRNIFTQITANADNIKSIYCGGYHTFALKNDGTLWGCGYNGEGALGLEGTDNRLTFTIIDSNPGNIKSIYCGDMHTIILKNDGTLWGCGNNNDGQLGLGDSSSRNVFTKITNDVKLAYSGIDYAFILKNDSTLWGCGSNNNGQLGLGDTSNRTTFTQITVNADNIKKFANDYPIASSVIRIYDLNMGLIETLDTNNFRNIPVNKFEKIKVLYTKPNNTILNCLISFDKKQTWKTFNGNTWTTISDTSGTNMIVNCMEIETLNSLNKTKLTQGGFTGDLDFKVVIKTNDENKTPSVTKIYIEYK